MNLKGILIVVLCIISMAYEVASRNKASVVRGSTPIGDCCSYPTDCVDEQHSQCSNSVCTCKATFLPSLDKTRCLKQQYYVGDPCEEPQQCLAYGSSCQGDDGVKVCTCDSDHVSSEDRTKCLAKAGLQEPCEEDAQCTSELSICEGEWGAKTCQCDETSIPSMDNSKCLRKLMLGGLCEESAQCMVPNSACLDVQGGGEGTSCQCMADYFRPPEYNDKCVQLAQNVGDSCAEHSTQCDGIQGATCDSVTKICVCRPGEYVESEISPGRCVTIVEEIGATCQESIQCTAGGLGNTSDCIEGTCQCRDGYSYIGGECSDSGPGLGDICHSDEECHKGVNNYTVCIPDWETHDFRCACIPEAIQEGGTCVMRKVGDVCSDNGECSRGIEGEVECESCMGICWCLAGHMPSDKWTKCVPMVCNAGKSFWEIVA